MTPTAFSSSDLNDAVLVEQSLAGDRQAFGRIVARYQSLVCALAYSATGSRSRSEDVAQETFFTAWRKLRDLQEPRRLSAWLCGIARNVVRGDLRRLGRQPAHAAAPLDAALELPGAEPLPNAEAVTNEEMALLWREVGSLPEIYREPLILYYRENQSVEAVAAALELTPDAAMQRLSRGRRQLQERMLVFVETTLQRSRPGAALAVQIEAALPILAGAGTTTATGAVSTAGTAKSGLVSVLLAWVAPLVGTLAAVGVCWSEIAQAPTRRERRYVARWMLALWLCVAGFVAALPAVSYFAHAAGLHRRDDWTATAPFVAVWFGFALAAVTLITLMSRGRAALRRQLEAEGAARGPAVQPSLRRSIATLAAVLTAAFWVLIFLAWQTGDRAVAVAIVAGLVLLGAAPFVHARLRPRPAAAASSGGWYLAGYGLVFLALLNWRLAVWLAPIYRVDLAAMHRLLPMSVIHTLSAVLIAWVALLVLVTRPEPESKP